MRDLTPEECEFIAGGLTTVRAMSSEYDPPEIVVVASPPPYYPPPYYPPYEPPSAPPPPPTGGNPGSGGGVVQPPPPPTLDHTVDQLSVDLANKIKQIPDHDRYEYGAWIYKDAQGNIKESNIRRGPDWGTSPFGDSLQAFGIPDGSTLIGQIHNHPTFNPEGQELTGRANPDNFDLNAIAQAGGYAQPGHSITVDLGNFRGYIFHDSVVDEYDRATHMTVYDTSHGIQEEPGTLKDSSTAI